MTIVDPWNRPHPSHVMRSGVCTRCGLEVGAGARSPCTAPPPVFPNPVRHVPVEKEAEVEMGKVNTYSYQGREVTIAELAETAAARDAGLSKDTIRMRLVKGWSVEDAHTVENGRKNPARPEPAPTKPATARPARKAVPRASKVGAYAAAAKPAPRPSIADEVRQEVRAIASATSPDELLRRFGYDVMDACEVPAGTAFLVRRP